MKKRILDLAVKVGYSRWGAWELLREFLQNGKDADDLGFPMEVAYDDDTATVIISNDGASLDHNTLILGATDKRGVDGQRGDFGEGYKLAAEACVALDIGCTIDNGKGELWTFAKGWSDDFNSDLLQVHIEPTSTSGSIYVTLIGIEREDFDLASSRCRFLNDDADEDVYASSDSGSILKGENSVGQLFCKGIWVCKLDGSNWTFGYDLLKIQLDRDRVLASPYALKRQIRNAISDAARNGAITADELWTMFRGEGAEARNFNNEYLGVEGAHQIIHEKFVKDYGSDAVPVATQGDFEKARQCGLKPEWVSPTQLTMLESVMGKLSDALTEREFNASEFYSPDELSEGEQKNLRWATYLVTGIEPWVEDVVQVVDFYGKRINARHTFRNGEESIQLSRKILRNRRTLIAALVHEAAHRYGDDGTADHRAAEERIFGDIISQCIS